MADQIAGLWSSRTSLSPGTVAGAPAVGVADATVRLTEVSGPATRSGYTAS